MPKRGSGKVLSLTSAATTVVGTVTSCHPLGENCGVEMTSPLASTLAEVCRDQPWRRVSLPPAARSNASVLPWTLAGMAGCVLSWAKSDEARRNRARTTKMTAICLPEFMVLLSIAGRVSWGSSGAQKCPGEWITLILIRFNNGVLPTCASVGWTFSCRGLRIEPLPCAPSGWFIINDLAFHSGVTRQ
jgi:hypothetical protein